MDSRCSNSVVKPLFNNCGASKAALFMWIGSITNMQTPTVKPNPTKTTSAANRHSGFLAVIAAMPAAVAAGTSHPRIVVASPIVAVRADDLIEM